MTIVAIDPGTRRAGYAVFRDARGAPALEECDGLPVRGKDLPAKLLHLHEALDRLFRRVRPGQVVIERPFVGKNARDGLTLNAGRAVCMLAAAAARARVFEYAPGEVKRAVTGNGGAPKAYVQRMVKLMLGLSGTPEPDVADAIALGLCHLNRR